MNDQPAPKHVHRYAEELVECTMQLGAILDHMYRHESEFPDAPPPPVVLCNLLAGSIAFADAIPEAQLKTARKALAKTSKVIERDVFLVDPAATNGADPDLN